jgi:hypothetical protein
MSCDIKEGDVILRILVSHHISRVTTDTKAPLTVRHKHINRRQCGTPHIAVCHRTSKTSINVISGGYEKGGGELEKQGVVNFGGGIWNRRTSHPRMCSVLMLDF